jgi:hypothetical protein
MCNYNLGAFVDGVAIVETLGVMGKCPNGWIVYQRWFTVSVEVLPDSDIPVIKMDGVRLGKERKMTFPRKAMGGIALPNKYSTPASFRNFSIITVGE